MRVRSLASPAVLVSLLALAPVATAQTKEEKKDDAKKEEAAPAADSKKDEAKKEDEEKEPVTKAHVGPVEDEKISSSDPREETGKTYYFVGLRYRQTFLPKFMLGLFVAGGPSTVSIPSFGIEGTMRKDGFDTTLHLTYADWGMEPFPFKGKDEANTAWEIVESRLKLINLGVDLLWGTDFSKMFSFQYGITAGISAVIGDLARVQGRPKAGTTDDSNPDNIEKCPGANGKPTVRSAYCAEDNDHYGDYTEKSWFNGGKKPNLYASFGPQLGFRFKPVKQFMARVFFGWDLFSGPFFGLNGNYGL
jgi:hypothetical protein